MPLKYSQTNTRESRVKSTVIDIGRFHTRGDYKSEKGNPLDNSYHTGNTS